MSQLDRAALEVLHEKLTEQIADRLEEAKGNPEKPLGAAEITAIAKFLKDNNITAVVAKSPAGRRALKALPFEHTDELAE